MHKNTIRAIVKKYTGVLPYAEEKNLINELHNAIEKSHDKECQFCKTSEKILK